MSNVVRFPNKEAQGFQRVKSTYTVREISQQFGLGEHHVRRWTREGLIHAVGQSESGETRYDFLALRQFRRVRELRGQGLSFRQIEAELRGQLNLFPEPEGRLIRLPRRLSPFEEALLLDEHCDSRAPDAYRKAIGEGDSVADAFCNLGILEFQAGNVAAAFDQFTKSLQHDPRHFESHFNLASLYFDQEDLRLARLHYELAAEIEPNFPDIFFNLGLVHALSGDFRAAVDALEKARDLATEEESAKVIELLVSLQKALMTQPEGPRV